MEERTEGRKEERKKKGNSWRERELEVREFCGLQARVDLVLSQLFVSWLYFLLYQLCCFTGSFKHSTKYSLGSTRLI